MLDKSELISLSKTISHALRHAPWLYELEMDDEGWTSLDDLLAALQLHRRAWQAVALEDIQTMIAMADKQRFEITDGKIRAFYGHTVPFKITKMPSQPPPILYHGTTDRVVDLILADGLRPMSRQYVHLSTDRETAEQVGSRKSGKVVLLQVEALQAHLEGVMFYHGNEMVWLADTVPPQYLRRWQAS